MSDSEQASAPQPAKSSAKGPLYGLIFSCITVAGYAIFIDDSNPSVDESSADEVKEALPTPPPTTIPTENSRKGERFQGTVQEAISVSSYSYLRLATEAGDQWVAVLKEDFSPGDTIDFEINLVMRDFKSKELERSFDLIYFGQRQAKHPANGNSGPTPNAGTQEPKQKVQQKVAPFQPSSDLQSIADLFQHADELVEQEVRFQGEVVKLTQGVMGTNFLHVQDGSGSAETKNNDIVVLVKNNPPSIGSRTQFKATLKRDIDYGSGYRFPVLLADGEVLAKK